MRLAFIIVVVVPVDIFKRFRVKPSMRFLFIHVFQRFRRLQHLRIHLENVFEVLIDLRADEKELTVFIVHQVDEECGKGKSNYHFVFEFRRLSAHAADKVEKLINIAAIENSSLRDIVDAIFKIDFQGWASENKFLEVLHLGDQTCLRSLNILPFL